MAMAASLFLSIPLLFLSACVDSLRFDVSGAYSKCLSEDIQTNVVVLANYNVVSGNTNEETPNISVKVTSPYGNTLHYLETVSSGQFSFTTKESGIHAACFWLPSSASGQSVNVELDWKTGIAAKDWETIAKKEKVEGVELELMKLHESVDAIHDNLVLLRQREREMREINELTNTRVVWFSFISLMVCLLVTGWQLWHLKSYFQKKKLI